LVSPFTWSPRPSAFSRGLPVARPAVFLAPPFMASSLCAIFLKILTGDTFRRFILLALTRQPRHRQRPAGGAGIGAGGLTAGCAFFRGTGWCRRAQAAPGAVFWVGMALSPPGVAAGQAAR
jgi:hypothetical protein